MEHSHSLSAEHGRTLLELAALAVEYGLQNDDEYQVDPAQFEAALAEPGGTFVSLHRARELLGCIGTLEARQPLVCDVVANAHGAAFRDPRLPEVTQTDLQEMNIEVSVLSKLVPVAVGSYEELLRQLEPGVDGLVVSVAKSRATFLPSVWQQIPEPADFVTALWEKGGLEPGAWPARVSVQRYETTVFASTRSDLGTNFSSLKKGA